MTEPGDFVNQALRYGFSFYSGVPCSYLKPLINYVIDHKELTYLASANEGDAVAFCSGAVAAGRKAVVMMQNSGLGNAVNPLTSLNYVFRIPLLLIVSLRGDSAFADEPQHELMGAITAKMLEVMSIPWEFFPANKDDMEAVIRKAVSYMDSEGRPFALILRKKTVAPYKMVTSNKVKPGFSKAETVDYRGSGPVLSSRSEMLELVVKHSPVDKTILVATTGYTGRELYAINDRENHLYMAGSMGCALPFGLGLAINCRNRRVIVLDGDGALLMRMGAMATAGRYGTGNLTHIVFDNGVYLSTGGQKTISDTVDFCAIASACAYKEVIAVNTVSSMAKVLARKDFHGDCFVLAQVNQDVPADLPRPKIIPYEVLLRLKNYIGK
ncbi:MAG TPA: phosphonopyruvate decarboxylase [Thermodesulfovibrionia bacterium]|nr:phosphonopyruvate decarboxylase [Thermodesulfovibrionia bacterium]